MSPGEFRKALERSEPDLPSHCLDFAIAFFVSQGWTGNLGDVQKCRQLAQGVHGLLESIPPQEERSYTPEQRPPSIDAIRDQRLADIKARVEQIRQTIFGHPDAPYTSFWEAMAWIKQGAQTEQHLSADDQQRLEELSQEISGCIVEWHGVAGEPAPWSYHHPSLPYIDPYIDLPESPNVLRSLPAKSGSPAWNLAVASKHLAEDTGFSQFSMVIHILTGLQIHLAPVTLKTRGALDVINQKNVTRQIVATFNTPELTFDHLRQLHRQIRQLWRPSYGHVNNERDERLRTLIKQHGDGPLDGKGTGVFWEKIRQEWNKAETHEQFRHAKWQQTQRRYQRLQDRHRSAAETQSLEEVLAAFFAPKAMQVISPSSHTQDS